MIWACVVQHYIYKTNACGDQVSACDTPSTLNVWIQTGSSVFSPLLARFSHSPTRFRYVLIALSEIFASITGLEYAFTKAPKNMRSLVLAIFYFSSALSAAIGEAFVCTFNSSFVCLP